MKITAVFAVALLLSMFSFGEEQISVSVVDANQNPIENNTIDDQLVITTDDWLILDALLQGKTGTNVESRLSQFNLSFSSDNEQNEQLYCKYLETLIDERYAFETSAYELVYAECLWYMCFMRPYFYQGIPFPEVDNAIQKFLSGAAVRMQGGVSAYNLFICLTEYLSKYNICESVPDEVKKRFTALNTRSSVSTEWLTPRFVQAASRAETLRLYLLQADNNKSVIKDLLTDMFRDPELLYVLKTQEPYREVKEFLADYIQQQNVLVPSELTMYEQVSALITEANIISAEYGIPISSILSGQSNDVFTQVMENTFAVVALDRESLTKLITELEFFNTAVPIYVSRCLEKLRRY